MRARKEMSVFFLKITTQVDAHAQKSKEVESFFYYYLIKTKNTPP